MQKAVIAKRILAVAVLITYSRGGYCAEPRLKDESPEKYRNLIQQLVSPNKKPETRNRSSGAVKFPDGYDVEAQKRIDAARQSLQSNFEYALPFLVDALNDDRYCMTIDWAEGDGFYNYSVGDICRDVIRSQLEVYRKKVAFFSPQHWNRFNYPISMEWWQTRKDKSLVDLQVEAIDWAIERCKNDKEGLQGDEALAEIGELKNLETLCATMLGKGGGHVKDNKV